MFRIKVRHPAVIISALFALRLTAFAASKSAASPFDTPETIQTLEIGITKDVEPPAPIRFECRVYPTEAVMQVIDPALVGANISVRKRENAMPIASLCAKTFPGEAHAISDQEGYVLGVSGPFLVTTSGDGFGVEEEMQVYELATGKLLFKDRYNTDKTLALDTVPPTASLRYFSLLKQIDCLPVDSACWNRVQKANGISLAAKIPLPNCKKAIAVEHSKRGEGLQVSVPARVSDLFHAQVVYENGIATCDAAP